MFRWYEASFVCYVYLSDVGNSTKTQEELRASRWFTRGWTLQELIAPDNVILLHKNWGELGTKRGWSKQISAITGIPVDVLTHKSHLRWYSVATRMSWAANRKTTREEDTAYCLFGLFDVNMPLLYGEGPKAFRRLQEEIMRTVDDASIFAWLSRKPQDLDGPDITRHGFLAAEPAWFGHFIHAMKEDFPDHNDVSGKLTFQEALRSETPCALSDHLQTPVQTAQGIRVEWPMVTRNGDDFVVIPCFLSVKPERSKWTYRTENRSMLLGIRARATAKSRNVVRKCQGRNDIVWFPASELGKPKDIHFLVPFVHSSPNFDVGCRLTVGNETMTLRWLDLSQSFSQVNGNRTTDLGSIILLGFGRTCDLSFWVSDLRCSIQAKVRFEGPSCTCWFEEGSEAAEPCDLDLLGVDRHGKVSSRASSYMMFALSVRRIPSKDGAAAPLFAVRLKRY